MSRLSLIYAALAKREVSYTVGETVVTPAVDEPHELKASYLPAELPRRLLLPQVAYGAEARQAHPTAWSAGQSVRVPWLVVDRLLMKPEGEGTGQFSDVAGALIEYMDAYIEAMMTQAPLVAKTAIVSLDIYAAALEWPLMSGVFYWGAEAVLQVEDQRAIIG